MAVMEALIPAIAEQKVTGGKAHRALRRLIQRYGEPAPGPRGLPGTTGDDQCNEEIDRQLMHQA